MLWLALRAVALVCCLALAGCAGGSRPADSGPPAVLGFPVVVAHGQGSARIPAPPRRVVAVGPADAQIAAALGANLVGMVRNPSSPDRNWPGMAKLPPEVLALDLVTPELERIGTALGQDARAAALIDDSLRRIERFAEARPRLRGTTYAFGQYGLGGLHLVLADDSASARFMADLGMRVPDGLKRLATPDNTRFALTSALSGGS